MLASDFSTSTSQHSYEPINGGYKCTVCDHVVKIIREGVCIGVPIFASWDSIPDTMATKTTLKKDHNKKPGKQQQPVGAKKKFNHRGKFTGHYYPLYSIADAEEKAPATPAQLAALDKARHMAEKLYVTCSVCQEDLTNSYGMPITVTRKRYEAGDYASRVCDCCKDRQKATAWATELLAAGEFVILDTETADLHGEIIEIGITDAAGNILLEQRIKPLGKIAPGAQRVHGIALDDLQDMPTFPEIYPQIRDLIASKTVIIYNAAYDVSCLKNDCKLHQLDVLDYSPACAMEKYAAWYGDWSNYWNSYRWQPLNGTHGAIGDCRATLERLNEMTQETHHAEI
ncbi:MAG: exonuclease domain-containing protein [Aggregatilineales bacterium]